ncbi:Protein MICRORCHIDIA 7 [Zea mays]|uniref:Protein MICRORCHIDIA 7 n=1 Tax=Zea mays TaxID=4577 RepID=A0A1D6QNI7_MAIZE|nr:Protein MICRORCHIDIA 7 [Zea mays]
MLVHNPLQIDYEKENEWKRKARTTLTDWCMSLETIIQWSPYSTEAELIQEFGSIGEQGTRIIIYNLWEDDEGELELDFDADANDIQIRGVNRDQNKIKKANQFPNSKHFFTYRHSLRSYASILYLMLPDNFQMILRGKKIDHHNIINDLMLKKQLTYNPTVGDGLPKDMHVAAKVTIGFVKDARQHIDIQGFNVYHKNRLIKPFWRVWTSAGVAGRGIIGMKSCCFFFLFRLSSVFEKNKDLLDEVSFPSIGTYSSADNNLHAGLSLRPFGQGSWKSGYLQTIRSDGRSCSNTTNNIMNASMSSPETSKLSGPNREFSSTTVCQHRAEKSANTIRSERSVLHGLSNTDGGKTETANAPSKSTSPILRTSLPPTPNEGKRSERIAAKYQSKQVNATTNGDRESIVDPEAIIKKLKEENSSLKERILMVQESLSRELQIERDKNKSLTERFEDVERQLELAIKEQEATVELFAEERKCHDQEVENLKRKLTVRGLFHHSGSDGAAQCCPELLQEMKQQTKQLHPPVIR